MLAAAIFMVFFFPLSYIYGWGLLRLYRNILRIEKTGQPSIPWVVIVGVVTLTTLGMTMSLFIPLGAAALGLAAAGAFAIAAFQFKHLRAEITFQFRGAPIVIWLLAGILVLAILQSSTLQPANPDTGLYHAQTIHWIEKYPVVPGLGNLNGRFAFNSSWLTTNALLSFAFLGIRSFHLLPASFFLAALLVGMDGARMWLRGQANAVNILKTLLIPAAFYVIGGEISSPGTDLPVVLIVWLLAVGWLERSQSAAANRAVFDLILFLLAIFALTVKLSAAPLLLIGVLIFVDQFKNRRVVLFMAGMSAVVLLPWMARGVILSGYPVYPIAGMPGINFDWRIPEGEVIREQLTIIAFGRNPRVNSDVVLQMPFISWVKTWFFNQTFNRRALLLLTAVSPLITFLIYYFIVRRTRVFFPSTRSIAEISIVNLLGAGYWLFTAPDFRFGYGYLIMLALLPLTILIASVKIGSPIPALVILSIVFFLIWFMAKSFESKDFVKRLVLPADYPSLPTEPCDLANGSILCPAEDSFSQCWYASFPCAPFPPSNVEFRGTEISSGFRTLP